MKIYGVYESGFESGEISSYWTNIDSARKEFKKVLDEKIIDTRRMMEYEKRPENTYPGRKQMYFQWRKVRGKQDHYKGHAYRDSELSIIEIEVSD